MELNDIERTLTSSGATAEYDFGIDEEDQVHLMMVLRDTLYKNAKLAVLREPSSNAWDANRTVNHGDIPIDVTLPTTMEPTLIIRDSGPGLSEEDVARVYTKYGKSTKRNDNLQTGTLGLGCKAPFAYTDSFSITSWFGGMKKSYVAVLDESNKGKIIKLSEVECPVEKTGVEIRVSVRPADIDEFRGLAMDLFKYFEPLPNINIKLYPPPKNRVNRHGFFTDDGSGWVAIMGCVAYRLDPAQIRMLLEKEQLWNAIRYSSGGLYFDIGDVHFSASREELKYDDETCQVVVAKFRSMVDDFLEEAFAKIADVTVSSWDKRLCVFSVKRKFQLGPQVFSEWSKDRILFKDDFSPKTFRFSGSTRNIEVTPHSRIILKDDDRSIRGYVLSGTDRVVIPLVKYSVDKVRVELEEFLKDLQLDGMPIVLASTLTWRSSGHNRAIADAEKHRKKVFRYNKTRDTWVSRKSDAWDVTEIVPSDEDVFVILENFDTIGCNIDSLRSNDRILAKHFKVEGGLPEIFGYKTTSQKPLKNADCKGVPYLEWRKKFWGALIGDKEKRTLKLQGLEEAAPHARYDLSPCSIALKHLTVRLGSDHIITELYRDLSDIEKIRGSLGEYWVSALAAIFEEYKIEAERGFREIYSRYPLLSMVRDNLNCFRAEEFGHCVDYVMMKDKENV